MNIDLQNNISTLIELMKGDKLSLVLDALKHDIAFEILHTKHNEATKREELYMLTCAISKLEMKLQEYVNSHEGVV